MDPAFLELELTESILIQDTEKVLETVKHLKTIAEGVEDEYSLAMLNLQHGDEAPGYYFARPMPAEEFARYMAAQ